MRNRLLEARKLNTTLRDTDLMVPAVVRDCEAFSIPAADRSLGLPIISNSEVSNMKRSFLFHTPRKASEDRKLSGMSLLQSFL